MFNRLVSRLISPRNTRRYLRQRVNVPLSPEVLEIRVLPATFTWIGGTEGLFGNAANWSGPEGINAVPGPTDDATVAGSNARIISSGSHTVNTFTGQTLVLTSGTFTVRNVNGVTDLPVLELQNGATLRTIGGLTRIRNAEIDGTINTLENATTNFIFGNVDLNPGASLIGAGQYLNGGGNFGGNMNVLTNMSAPRNLRLIDGGVGGTGTFTFVSGSKFEWVGGSLFGSARFLVQSGANFDMIGTTSSPIIDTATIINNGTFRYASERPFVMRGGATINNRPTGVLLIEADSHFAGSGGVGDAGKIMSTGVIRKTGGTGNTILAGALNLTGTLEVDSGQLTLRGGQVQNATIKTAEAAVMVLTGDSNFVPQTTLYRGTITFAGSGIVEHGAGDLSIAAQGATFIIPAATTFNLYGTVTVPAGATFTTSGNVRLPRSANTSIRGGGTFVANGATTHSGTGTLLLDSDTTLRIPLGRNYNFANDAAIAPSGRGGILENHGTIIKSAGVGTSQISTSFIKAANFSIRKGTLVLKPSDGALEGGVLNVLSGAVLDLTGGGITTMTGVFKGSGQGEVRVASGSISAAVGGGPLTFSLPNGLLRLQGGTINTNGNDITISGAVNVATNSQVTISGGGTCHLTGPLTHSGIGNLVLSGATFRIAPGGTYELRSSGGILQNAASALNVEGILLKAAGAGTSTVAVPVSNSGQVIVRTGTLSLTGGVSEFTSGALTGGRWSAFSTATNSATLNLGESVKTISVAATVTLSGPNSSLVGQTELATVQGSLILANNAALSVSGNLTNSGQITLNKASVLNVGVRYTQSSGGRLTLQMVDGAMGHIKTASASLSGSLFLRSTGVLPAIGKIFTFIHSDAPVTGIFTGLANNDTFSVGGMTFRINYGSKVRLTRTA